MDRITYCGHEISTFSLQKTPDKEKAIWEATMTQQYTTAPVLAENGKLLPPILTQSGHWNVHITSIAAEGLQMGLVTTTWKSISVLRNGSHQTNIHNPRKPIQVASNESSLQGESCAISHHGEWYWTSHSFCIKVTHKVNLVHI